MQLKEGFYRVEGHWTPGLYPEPRHTFQGQLVFERKEEELYVNGAMIDEHGVSRVIGKITDLGSLEFLKSYDTEHRLFHGNKETGEPVTYSLVGSETGGWTGIWKIPNSRSGRSGYVTLAIVPWNSAYPVSQNLRDYLGSV